MSYFFLCPEYFTKWVTHDHMVTICYFEGGKQMSPRQVEKKSSDGNSTAMVIVRENFSVPFLMEGILTFNFQLRWEPSKTSYNLK